MDVVREELKKTSIGNLGLRTKLSPNVLLFDKERAKKVKRPMAENTKRKIQNMEEGVLEVPLSCGSD